MSINYKKLGRRISIARERQRMTQEELAEKVNCSPSFISYIETGRKKTSLEKFIEIANALNCTADELLVDLLNNNLTVRTFKFASLMEDCDQFEMQILFDVVGAAKNSLRKYARSIHPPRR